MTEIEILRQEKERLAMAAEVTRLDVARLRVDVDRLETILRGDRATGKGGAVVLLEKTAETVFDKDEGLTKKVEELTKIYWKLAGGLIALVGVIEIIVQFILK